jgi:hypothetical protein
MTKDTRGIDAFGLVKNRSSKQILTERPEFFHQEARNAKQ